MSHLDFESAEEAGNEQAECPFCGAINESCKHLIVCFDVSEGAIEAGLIVDHQDEIAELMRGGNEDIAESSLPDLDIGDLIATLRAFLEQHPEVEWAEYGLVGESDGIWDYANYWARYPGMVIDDLYRHLETAANDY